MKNAFKYLFYLAALLLVPFVSHAQSPRKVINMNPEWKFKLGDYLGAEQAKYSDSAWQNIGLPHSFSIPYFLSPDIYVGYGWYRKNFHIPKEYLVKCLNLEFEAAFQDAEIFVNGQKVGEHKGGYTGFSIDISKAVKEGNNLIAVRLNNKWNARLAPRAGGYIFSGGIYRDVRLVVTNPVHVAWYGTYVTTPKVSKTSAYVNIKTEVFNSTLLQKQIQLITTLYNPSGQLISKMRSTQRCQANTSTLFNQTARSLPNPSLWSPAQPNLYKAKSDIYLNGRLIDTYETIFGIRSIVWTAEKGLFVNGKHTYIRGVNAHQDHAGWSDAVTDSSLFRDVKMIKDGGFNFIRGSHYPHDPAYSEACDKLGVMLWEENVFWGIGGFKGEGYWDASSYPPNEADRPEFEASVKQQLKEMIRIHRNHPSVIIWSMSNEPFFTTSATIDAMRNLLKQEVELAHQLDPSRLAAIGGSQRPLGSKRIDKIADVAGYNGDGGTIPEFQNPGIPSMVTEYGSTSADRPGKYEAGWGNLNHAHSEIESPWRSGKAIWSAFDYGCFAGSLLAKMGIIDYFRIPKRSWYWYRKEYRNIPPPIWPSTGTPAGLELTASKTNHIKADGTDDVQLRVSVVNVSGTSLSNSPPVTLKLVSGPGEFPTGSLISFEAHSDIRISDGQAAIEFRSFYSGETLIEATSPGLTSSKISLHFEGGKPYVKDNTSVASIRPYIHYKRQRSSALTDNSQTFGRNNPSFASSADSNHASGLAGDGNSDTWWQALPSDLHPFWTLDTEKGLDITQVKIEFKEPVMQPWTVEISEDNMKWHAISDKIADKGTERYLLISLSPSLKGRFVRIRFLNTDKRPPKIAEVEVTGRVLE